jgi:hypothetical protein
MLLVSITFFLSCKQKAKDVKLNDLKGVCDYIDAGEIIADEMIELKKQHPRDIALGFRMAVAVDDPIGEFKSEYTVKYQALKDKLEDIGKAAEKKFTEKEVKECDGFKKFLVKRDSAFLYIEITPDMIKDFQKK